MSTGFIADLHLDESAPAVSAAAEAYFRAASEFDVLWILGDLFDAWIGDDRPFAELSAPMQALSDLVASGTDVHLMHGNRDFLLGTGFSERTGVHVHANDAVIIELDTGLPFTGNDPGHAELCLLMHGDTLCTDDTGYLQLRKTLRDEQYQQDFLARPLEERALIAQQMRDGSRLAMSDKDAMIMDVTDTGVAEALSAHRVSTLVHGHTHRPADHRPACTTHSPDSRRVVLGDWHAEGAQVARHDKTGGLQLLTYSAP